MRILIYGDDKEGSGGWCYGNAFEQLGHKVYRYSDWTDLSQYSKDVLWRFYRKLFSRVLEYHRHKHIDSFIKFAKEVSPDLIVVLKGLHLGFDDVNILKESSKWIININHDDFFSAYPLNRSLCQFNAIPAYDYIFCTRQVNVQEIYCYNRNVEFFSFSYDPNLHKVLELSGGREKYRFDISFIGTYAYHRSKMLSYLIKNVPANYAIYGTGWNHLPLFSNVRKYVLGDYIKGNEFCNIIGNSKVSLGFLRKENRDEYTQRTFEIPACGGLLLAERTDTHKSIFREGKDAFFFDPYSPDDLVEKVQFVLNVNNKSICEEIRRNGTISVKAGKYTYLDRIVRLLDLYKQFAR